MQKLTTIYKVDVTEPGNYAINEYFFATDREATEFYEKKEYADKPKKVKMTLKKANTLLKETQWVINYLNFING